jgi:DNA-binding transcriptional LysR family regulator
MEDRLSLEGLRYARAVAESQSFTAAARAYGVTQPALSNGIAKLEERLGTRLFDRSKRGAKPTTAGERLLPGIARAVAEVDAVIAESRRLSGRGSPQVLRVGMSPLISQHLVARAFAAARALETPRDLVLREANMDDLRDELIAGDLDMVIIPSVATIPRFEHRVIASEPVVLVESSPSTKLPIELAEVVEKELIMVPDGCGLTTFTKQLFAALDTPLRIYPGEATSYSVLEQWAQLGLGAAILPESKLTSPDVPHRRLSEHGVEVEIFYAAIWAPSTGLASDLGALADSIGKSQP